MDLGSFKELFPFAPIPLASTRTEPDPAAARIAAPAPEETAGGSEAGAAPPTEALGLAGSASLLYKLVNGPLRRISSLGAALATDQRKFVAHLLERSSTEELALLVKLMAQLINIILRPDVATTSADGTPVTPLLNRVFLPRLSLTTCLRYGAWQRGSWLNIPTRRYTKCSSSSSTFAIVSASRSLQYRSRAFTMWPRSSLSDQPTIDPSLISRYH